MKNPVLTIMVSAMLITASGSVVSAANFSDTSGHWAEETIEKWVDRGLVSGYPDGTFLPDNPVTRAEFVKIITTAFDLENTNENKLLSNPYDDVDEDSWYWEYLRCADIYVPCYPLPVEYDNNKPYEENNRSGSKGFLPDTPVLRVHAAEALSEIKIVREDLTVEIPDIYKIKEDLLARFRDTEYDNLYAGLWGIPNNVQRMFKYTWLASELGIMQGNYEGVFDPYGHLTRAELVTITDRMISDR